MKFRTEYKASPSILKLDPTRPIVLVGSCFASNIASKMKECMWDAVNNVGTLYNPMSISKVLELLVFTDDYISELDASLFEANGKIHSWLFDSHFSSGSKERLLQGIQESRIELLSALQQAQALVVTFGTSWCYELADEEAYIVANCHKMPSRMFIRKRMSVEAISTLWQHLCQLLQQEFPELNIIFTVSPVRHLKDGFEGNTLSKATLHLAVENICANLERCHYFPAYELVCDDLRDYRFYASDLVHPSDMAIEYIWEGFCDTFLDDSGKDKIKEGNKKFKALNHRPIMIK